MASNDQQACYVYIQLPGTVETVPCASLKVRSLGAGAFEGTFTYGKRYLARPDVVALDPYHLPLSTRPRPKVTVEDGHKLWLAKLPEQADRHNMQRIEHATLELARAAGPRLRNASATRGQTRRIDAGPLRPRMESGRHAYWRHGLVSGLTVLDAEDGYVGRERWSYPLLADELRRWSVKSNDDRRELFLRMVFNAMVTNNDDHPRNHALLQTRGGWRLSPAYDILPVPLVSVERRDLALEVGRFGRAASLYNILSQCRAFGLSTDDAQAPGRRHVGRGPRLARVLC